MTNPLRGRHIVSLALNLPGPVAVASLRKLGASVTKVEPPSGDPLAAVCRGWYDTLMDGVEVVRLELKDASARARLESSLGQADLLLTSMRPAALARLGLHWDALHRRHPRLCHVAIVGYPAPRQDQPGHDLTYQAEAGLVAPPALPRTLMADLAGAQQVVSTALALFLGCERGGDAGYAEVSLAAVARMFAEPLARGLTTPDGALGGHLSTYALFRTTDGWVAIAALEPRFVEVLGLELRVDLRDRDQLERLFATRTAREWQRWAEARDLPIVAVRASGDLPA